MIVVGIIAGILVGIIYIPLAVIIGLVKEKGGYRSSRRRRRKR